MIVGGVVKIVDPNANLRQLHLSNIELRLVRHLRFSLDRLKSDHQSPRRQHASGDPESIGDLVGSFAVIGSTPPPFNDHDPKMAESSRHRSLI
jgi:hypothetical protein